jgi:surface protein
MDTPFSKWDVSTLQDFYGTVAWLDTFHEDSFVVVCVQCCSQHNGWHALWGQGLSPGFVLLAPPCAKCDGHVCLMFGSANAFDNESSISCWNVSNVTTMASMFAGAAAFNKNISNWNVSNVKSMNATLGQPDPSTRIYLAGTSPMLMI